MVKVCTTHKKIPITLEINPQPIGEGSFRRAFVGTVTQGTFGEFGQGDRVVVKTIRRDRFDGGSRHALVDVKVQTKSQSLVEAFVQAVGTGNRVREGMPGGDAVMVSMRSTLLLTLKEAVKSGTFNTAAGEQVAVEKLIPGKWEKFNSNGGWSSGRHLLPDALSHWTWVHSQGDYLLCDLQGVRTSGRDACYVFTDPAIITKKPRAYGDADLGTRGISNWFANHTCNALCHRIGIDKKRPDNPAHCFEAKRSTTYMNVPAAPRLCASINSKPCKYGSACRKKNAGCYYAHPM
jgi:hypothetical protein